MTTITLVKDLPTSTNYYTNGGTDTTITIHATKIIMHTKKSLIKIKRARTKSRQQSNPTDQPDNKIIDLQRVDEELTIQGWLDDDETETAWNKAWKLRAMATLGGPLKKLIIGEPEDSSPPKITFGEGDVQQAFLEEVTFIGNPDDTGAITQLNNAKPARLEINLHIYFGDER
ncbi:MAG: hypothetical protein DRI86_11135 [Bacteroidetes bacterium]|nr:MAG: hypothetical protein DRI86_11135 [Bacteroidota bacterium]